MATDSGAMSIYDDTGNGLVDFLMSIGGVFTMDKNYEWLREPEVGG